MLSSIIKTVVNNKMKTKLEVIEQLKSLRKLRSEASLELFTKTKDGAIVYTNPSHYVKLAQLDTAISVLTWVLKSKNDEM